MPSFFVIVTLDGSLEPMEAGVDPAFGLLLSECLEGAGSGTSIHSTWEMLGIQVSLGGGKGHGQI